MKVVAFILAVLYGAVIAVVVASVLLLVIKPFFPELDPYPPAAPTIWNRMIPMGAWGIAIAVGFREGLIALRRQSKRPPSESATLQ